VSMASRVYINSIFVFHYKLNGENIYANNYLRTESMSKDRNSLNILSEL
jgi:hypothetical protein